MAEKCYQMFLSGIRTEKTREKYEYYLQRFLKETKLKNFTALIELDDETRQDIIEKYILLLKSRDLKRTSVRPVLYAIELFFDMNKKILHKTVLSKMVQGIPDHIKGGEKAFKAENDLKRIEVEARQHAAQTEGIAQANIAEANGEAEAIKIINEALSTNPNYLEWLKTQQWDGKLPLVVGEGGTPFIAIPTQ